MALFTVWLWQNWDLGCQRVQYVSMRMLLASSVATQWRSRRVWNFPPLSTCFCLLFGFPEKKDGAYRMPSKGMYKSQGNECAPIESVNEPHRWGFQLSSSVLNFLSGWVDEWWSILKLKERKLKLNNHSCHTMWSR